MSHPGGGRRNDRVFGPEDVTPNAQTDNLTPAPTINLASQTAQYVSDVKDRLVAAGVH
jgi:hypothetical protein